MISLKSESKTKTNKFIYYLLLISSITGAWTSLPFYNKVYAFHIFIILYTVSSFINTLKGQTKLTYNFKIMNFNLFIIVWYLYIIITYFWTKSPEEYFKYLVLYTLAFYYLFILISNNKDVNSLKKTFRYLYVCFLISLVIGILEAKTSFRLWGSPYLRKEFSNYGITMYNHLMVQPTAYFHNPNNFATFLLFGIAFILSLILYSEKKVKYYFVLLFALIVLYLSNSRGNILGTILMMFSFIMFQFKIKVSKQKLLKVFGIVLIIMMILLYNIYVSDAYVELIDTIDSAVEMLISADFSKSTSGSTRYRWILITDAFEIIKNNPFGVGAGNSSYYLGIMQANSSLNIHNWFLELALDFGFPFLICYLTFYSLIMKNLYKCIYNKEQDNMFLKIVATGCFFAHVGFIMGMVSPSSVIYFLPYWVLLGISISVINIYREENY